METTREIRGSGNLTGMFVVTLRKLAGKAEEDGFDDVSFP